MNKLMLAVVIAFALIGGTVAIPTLIQASAADTPSGDMLAVVIALAVVGGAADLRRCD